MTPDSSPAHILAFATQGTGHSDGRRIAALLAHTQFSLFPFDRKSKCKSAAHLLRHVRTRHPELLVMEGTGCAGGLACILARVIFQTRYVVSSGDAVSPFLSAGLPAWRPLFALYERLLCRLSSGFIGWTPYLTGRALTFGAPRAMTAPGWSEVSAPDGVSRQQIRSELGIPESALVIGIVGSLQWDRRRHYCYGHELIQAVRSVSRRDLRILIVGDGSGLTRLKDLAMHAPHDTVIFTGRVPHPLVYRYLAAMDLASLPQSVDGVGSFRYTIKLPEYLAANLPIVTNQIPLAYDLDQGFLFRLPGASPWDPHYISALASLMESVTVEDIRARCSRIPLSLSIFERDEQVRRVTEFVHDIIGQSLSASATRLARSE